MSLIFLIFTFLFLELFLDETAMILWYIASTQSDDIRRPLQNCMYLSVDLKLFGVPHPCGAIMEFDSKRKCLIWI